MNRQTTNRAAQRHIKFLSKINDILIGRRYGSVKVFRVWLDSVEVHLPLM